MTRKEKKCYEPKSIPTLLTSIWLVYIILVDRLKEKTEVHTYTLMRENKTTDTGRQYICTQITWGEVSDETPAKARRKLNLT